MANQYQNLDSDKLLDLVAEYIIECENNKKEHVSVKGDVTLVKDRKVAGWKYFVGHWLINKGFDFYTRQYTYEIEKDDSHPLSDTIKKAKARLDSYSEDVVANEGKGIFWAKNRLAMHDRQQLETKTVEKFDFE
jgi:hypothetical protein